MSGAKKWRPKLDRMIAAVEAGEVDTLASPWIDRLGRSLKNSIELFETLDAARVELWKPTGQRFDGETPKASCCATSLRGSRNSSAT